MATFIGSVEVTWRIFDGHYPIATYKYKVSDFELKLENSDFEILQFPENIDFLGYPQAFLYTKSTNESYFWN